MTDKLITFQPDGTPFSLQFDDIYFDSKDGIGQSQAVFVEASRLQEKLLATPYEQTITLAETGFGTGLNFLLTLNAYHKLLIAKTESFENAKSTEQIDSPEQILPSLHFISTEKYPLSLSALTKSLAAIEHLVPELAKELQPFVDQLLNQYQFTTAPAPLAEHSVINGQFFNGKVTLAIYCCDVIDAFAAMANKSARASKRANKKRAIPATKTTTTNVNRRC